MKLTDAADICHEPFRQRGPQDETLDLADRLFSEQRRKELEQERAALKHDHIARAHANGYGLAVRDLEGAACNLRAYSRGMIPRELLAKYIAQGRAALDRIEQSLTP